MISAPPTVKLRAKYLGGELPAAIRAPTADPHAALVSSPGFPSRTPAAESCALLQAMHQLVHGDDSCDAFRFFLSAIAPAAVDDGATPFETPTSARLRVAVLAENPIARLGLSSVLRDLDDIDVVTELPRLPPPVEAALGGLDWRSIDVVVVDAYSTGDRWPAFVGQLLDGRHMLRVIAIIDPHAEPDGALPQSILGMGGVLSATALQARLPAAIRAVVRGEQFVGGDLSIAAPCGPPAPANPAASAPETLSEREHQILQMLADGMRNTEIARTLFFSVPTVKRYTQGIYQKLDARDRPHAVAIAYQRHLIH